ncbi:Hsp20/alpha crystallin family protein [Streptomyces mirabilis]|uniref:Hsp20/alpha crystallin family protein n=1 Tax=Streptomyces TaxID=1883 RepID=UPI0029B70996|nr:Hsp20/alpha crystallin family protein [Streptomyces sp. AK02-04a]MDX3758519.1 Hsp20/alpha crystallin family protein [Streptomyces sp. AK02-04a]
MTLPARHRHGSMLERAYPPIAAEFDEFFERMNRFLESAAPSWTEPMAWAPLADLSETDEAYKIECELPGIKREDINVEVSGRELHITGELKEREREGVLRRAMRRTGRFEYRALLPTDVKAEDVHATLADGILTVAVPKAQAAKPHHIEIES